MAATTGSFRGDAARTTRVFPGDAATPGRRRRYSRETRRRRGDDAGIPERRGGAATPSRLPVRKFSNVANDEASGHATLFCEQYDRHIRRIEELDRVRALLAAVLLVLDRQVDAPALEVDDDDEDEGRGHEVREVGEVRPVERFLQSARLVGPREHQVEERDDRALELRAAARVEGGGRERFPDDVLADVGRDEERDTCDETTLVSAVVAVERTTPAVQRRKNLSQNGPRPAEISTPPGTRP